MSDKASRCVCVCVYIFGVGAGGSLWVCVISIARPDHKQKKSNGETSEKRLCERKENSHTRCKSKISTEKPHIRWHDPIREATPGPAAPFRYLLNAVQRLGKKRLICRRDSAQRVLFTPN